MRAPIPDGIQTSRFVRCSAQSGFFIVILSVTAWGSGVLR